ncbi:uncharacterized protein LOC115066381 [Bactrocera dorsalis]|uniref:Uncharacterized protein LOC115066381 n=1 Tax=Bactrocera dorsalis TaxID=27457 RepID=A0A8N4QGX7_BACDO|nr:uncharacterized protein LOC115066381 [Bactrocera dorsalis]
MDLNLIKNTVKKHLTVFKIRLYTLDITSALINIHSLHYNSKNVTVKNSRINHYQRIARRIFIFIIFVESLFTIVAGSGISIFRKYYPNELDKMNCVGRIPLERVFKLVMTTSAIKYCITFCVLFCWWNKQSKRAFIKLLNELLRLCRRLTIHFDIDCSKLPPQCSLLFHLQFLVIIGNLLNNLLLAFTFNDIYSSLRDFFNGVFYAPIPLMYQTVLLTLCQLHYKANAQLDMYVACDACKNKYIFKFIVFLSDLKTFQNRFAKAFIWLPRLVAIKTFLIVGECSYLWHYQNHYNTLADVKLIWLYTAVAESLLDIFLMVFMLNELRRLDLQTQHLLYLTVINLHNEMSYRGRRVALREHGIYLSTPQSKSYTLHLHHFVEQLCYLQVWTILIPVLCGFMLACLDPFDMMFIRDLSQFNSIK